VVPDYAAGSRAGNGVVARHVSGNGTDGGSLDATFRKSDARDHDDDA
jgi:hypothetical protein